MMPTKCLTWKPCLVEMHQEKWEKTLAILVQKFVDEENEYKQCEVVVCKQILSSKVKTMQAI